MRVTRRQSLRLIGSALAFPYVLRADRAAAAPIIRRVGAPYPLGPATYDVAISPFPNGTYIAGYMHDAGHGETRAFIRYFNSLSQAMTPPIQMGGATGPTDGTPATSISPVAYPDGSAGILFSAQTNGGAPATFPDVYFQPMTANRQKSGPPFRVNVNPARYQTAVLAARSPHGNIPAVWADQGLSFDSEDIHTQVLNHSGHAFSSERNATADTAGIQLPWKILPLQNGNYILSYTTFLPGQNQWRKAFQLFGPNGVRIGSPHVIDHGEDPFGSVGLAAKPGSLAAWYAGWYRKRTNTSADIYDLLLQAFTGNGTPGLTQKVHTFNVDFWVDTPPKPPQIDVLHDTTAGDSAFISVYAVHGANRTIDCMGWAVNSGQVLALPTSIYASPATGLHPVLDAQARLSAYKYIIGYSVTDGNPAHSKAYLQPVDWQVM